MAPSFSERTFYAVSCDYPGCAELADDGEYTYWTDKDGAVQNAVDSGWTRVEAAGDDRMFCTNHEAVYREPEEDALLVTLPDGSQVEVERSLW